MQEFTKSLMKKKHGNRIPKEIWLEVDNDHRSGLFTLKELSEKHGVKVTTMENHFKKHRVRKGVDLPVIQGSIAERNKKRFIQAGVSRQRVADAIMKGMTEPIKVVFEGKGENMQATTQPDYQMRLNYIQEYNKMTAGYGQAEKEEKHLHLHMDSDKMKDLDANEAIKEYNRLIQG